MKKSLIVVVFALILVACMPEPKEQPPAEETPKVTYQITAVGDGLYMLAGEGAFTGGNLGLLVGEDGVVLIDDSMPPFLDIMNQAISSVTDQPIDFVINTHVHGDHMGNNAALGEAGTHIVAHDNLREHLVTKGVRGPGGMVDAPKAALPVLTFTDQMTFHFNGHTAITFHEPDAHTDGDAIIHFKEANVIHAGDIYFNGMFPFIDLASGGSVAGFINAQQAIIDRSNDETKIIPGHGPLSNKQELQAAVAMLIDAKKLIGQHVEDGKTLEEVLAANPLQKYHDDWNWGFITTERMTTQVYNDLKVKHAKDTHGHEH